MTRKPHIAIIIGSTRAARFADKPAAWLLENAQKRDDMSFELVDLRDYDLPLFDEVASNLWVPSQDPRAIKWQQKLAEFDGYVFVTSEYNHSISGSLKNALDQAYKEWNHKPAAAMGYGGVGAARAIEHLRGIAVELQMVPLRNAVHLGGGDFFKVSPLGANGEMAEVEANLLPSLNAMLDELLWWAEATMAQRAKTA
ncbi:NADPH-dependent FMN reductase [Paracoccus denitrificans]|jgi:NAD(P)H-dependent FMN reductase|uniref:NADPH-dependent FMN reductase n=1 Tax=Paracoccus denitrificans (strain Pd 1222) TaxID=318586 RepID=A1AYV0_PARDP|nr:NADPH-dependent FMN reductase [Paracoccus denitrificans]ABL68444.1 NADPH-dependent FMN reductase [Paracoccus denitrificans PD1222]MBB4627965.1 NAD(P)H-dependent FMN reductase [Paracoccus denitrificans]MCU7428504.1 NAD(P)H-dependent oxidoreductase [Paracoccus denitrificans]QAR26518.1 NADPH-dependent oxidoreductase [Paracoccus denitrificans]UPV95457.1 NAD(P)H-dependent oxidoreductase [Paracoccus denitrificans]